MEMSNKTENLLGVLIEAGIDSRRRLVSAILEGRVRVNGQVVTVLRHPLSGETDSITIDGRPVKLAVEQNVYLLLNKPEGVLSTVSDERGRPTVLDIIPEKYKRLRLYPAGRLDMDSSGLLLLTNDGPLTHRLTHPSFTLEKEYLVRIEGRLTAGERRLLESGILLEDGPAAPAVAKEVKSAPPNSYSITIHEGRKRQVRRMFAALDHQTLTLKRVRMGSLTLGDLKEGEIRELTGDEVKQVTGS